MSMIFPGMDPYLEDPAYWKGVHTRLIVYLAEQLNASIAPRFVASIEVRTFVGIVESGLIRRTIKTRAERNDVDEPLRVRAAREEISQAYVALIEPKAANRVIAVIEVVSPSNKRPGPARESYLAKQAEALDSGVHLIEIDLLRSGLHVAAVPEWASKGDGSRPYLVSVNRAMGDRSEFEFYPRGLRERLPRFALPVAEGVQDVPSTSRPRWRGYMKPGCIATSSATIKPARRRSRPKIRPGPKGKSGR